ncbi:MFS transporter [Micromonospora sp. WMMD1120]|uniref:MFS transporter n=1 Tax=Micromonospora sp. WMMD1120 TaxID=3016106 RepID=UPI002415E410|nr:MFS transporter [Micromonospora sp. WMMD1120]MDG4807543.1 MFS transporter [Micromonospora sp. WMMD1120]
MSGIGLRGVLRVPGVSRLLAAQTFTVFGDTALVLSLAVWTENRTGNSSAASMTIFAFLVGVVLAPSAGRFVSRHQPRWMMALSNLTAGGIVLLLLMAEHVPFWLVYPFAALYAFAGSIFAGVLVGYLREQVAEPLRVPVNAEFQSLQQVLRLVAPVAGVWLLETGGNGLVVFVVTGTLVVGAVLVLLCPDVDVPPEPALPGPRWGSYGLIWADRNLRRVSVLAVLGNGAQGFAQTLGFLVIQHSLHRSAGFIAVFVTIQSLAGIISTRIGAFRRITQPVRLVRIGLLLAGVGYAVLLLPGLYPVLGAFVIVGAGLPWVRIGYTSALQNYSTPATASRIALAGQSLLSLAQTAFIAVGALLGLFVDWWVLAVTMVVVFLTAAAIRGPATPPAPALPPTDPRPTEEVSR